MAGNFSRNQVLFESVSYANAEPGASNLLGGVIFDLANIVPPIPLRLKAFARPASF
jgi:hypothetical protein